MEWAPGRQLTIGIDGTTLEARVWGPPPDVAPTLVLLHEGLGSVSLWRGFPEALATETGWGVFAYSRAGYGQSDPANLPRPIDYMTCEAQEILPLVLDGFGFEKGVLLGHSDGASIAAIHAGTVADRRVRGIVLMAPHFFTEPQGLASIASAKTAYESTDLAARMARHHRNPDNTFYGWNDAWLNPEFAAWNIEDCIRGIACPVLAIQGLDDQYGTMAQIDALAAGTAGAFTRLDMQGCQHAPHLEQPERTLAAVAAFVTGQVDVR